MYNNLQNIQREDQREGQREGQQEGQQEGQREGENNAPKKSFIRILRDFLDNKTNTILSAAAATAIAFGFRDLVLSTATNIVHPLSIKLISLIGLSKYINLGDNNSYNIFKNFTNFITSLVGFISILLVTYYFIEVLNNKSYFAY
jgi:large-conductance mechanosensitive channel